MIEPFHLRDSGEKRVKFFSIISTLIFIHFFKIDCESILSYFTVDNNFDKSGVHGS